MNDLLVLIRTFLVFIPVYLVLNLLLWPAYPDPFTNSPSIIFAGIIIVGLGLSISLYLLIGLYKWKYLLKLINPLKWFSTYGVWYDLKWWFLHRTFDRYDIIKISTLKPGYYDKDTIMLHGMFELLVDYVEVELGYRGYYHDDDQDIVKSWSWPKRFLAWLDHQRFIRHFTKMRYPELGMRGLDFYINYEDEQFPDSPAIEGWRHHGRECLFLYLWWTRGRPNRPDSMEVTGLYELYDKYPVEFEPTEGGCYRMKKRSPEIEEEFRRRGEERYQLEESYEKEDGDMLKRLVDVRRGMWT